MGELADQVRVQEAQLDWGQGQPPPGDWGPSSTRFDPWGRLPEIELLAQIAAHLQVSFSIGGSVARAAIAGVAVGALADDASLFDFVPVLSSIDLYVELTTEGDRILALVRAHLPTSRFFSWEVQTGDKKEGGRKRPFLKVDHDPLLQFVPTEVGHKNVAGVVFWIGSDDKLVSEAGSDSNAPSVVIRRDVTSDIVSSQAADLFLDALYLVRRFPQHAAVPDLLGRYISKFDSEAIATVPRPRREQVIRSLLKLAYSRLSEDSPASDPSWVGLLQGLADRSNDRKVQRALAAVFTPATSGRLLTTVRPEVRRAGWVPLIRSFKTEKAAGTETIIYADAGGNGMVASPGFDLTVEKPQAPGCCRYRDFARGIAEFVWSEREPVPTRHWHFALVDLSEGKARGRTNEDAANDLAVAPAWVSRSGHVASMRVDYNFISTMAGRRRRVRVAASFGRGARDA